MAADQAAVGLAFLEKARLRLPLLFGSALLGVLAYPTVNWHLVIWVSLVPVFASALARTPRQAFFDGWLQGIVFFTLLLRWLDHTFRTYSVIPWPLTWLPILGLAGYCGLYTGLVAAGVSWLRCRLGPAPSLAAAPVLWIAGEWVRGHALSGFPWGLLGYSQAFALPVIQIAEWTGVYGVSFLVVVSKATPPDVVRYLHDATRAAMDEASFTNFAKARVIELDYRAGDKLRADLWQEFRNHTEILKRIGMIKK